MNECTYLVDEQPCGKPVVADVYRLDELRGAILVVRLCRRHWTPKRQAIAFSEGMTYTERETVVAA